MNYSVPDSLKLERKEYSKSLVRRMLWAPTALVLSAFTPGLASAVTYSGSVSTGAGDVNPFESASPGTNTATRNGFAQTVTSAANGTNATARASAGPGGLGRADSRITYTFQIVGPESSIYIPFRVQASGYAQGAGELFGAYSAFRLDNTFASVLGEALASDGGFGPYGEFNIDQIAYGLANRDLLVTTLASASAGGFAGRSGTAFAYVDPVFTLDPAYADQYRIVGVPGVFTSPAVGVPEPASWAMMITGFGLSGAAMRSRRRIAVYGGA